jgi:hypothetical protein
LSGIAAGEFAFELAAAGDDLRCVVEQALHVDIADAHRGGRLRVRGASEQRARKQGGQACRECPAGFDGTLRHRPVLVANAGVNGTTIRTCCRT